jgi:hypothetical protein
MDMALSLILIRREKYVDSTGFRHASCGKNMALPSRENPPRPQNRRLRDKGCANRSIALPGRERWTIHDDFPAQAELRLAGWLEKRDTGWRGAVQSGMESETGTVTRALVFYPFRTQLPNKIRLSRWIISGSAT